MNSLKKHLFQLYFIIIYLFINSYCIEEIINSKDLNEITQCFYQEKSTFSDKEEIIYAYKILCQKSQHRNKYEHLIFLIKSVLTLQFPEYDIGKSKAEKRRHGIHSDKKYGLYPGR